MLNLEVNLLSEELHQEKIMVSQRNMREKTIPMNLARIDIYKNYKVRFKKKSKFKHFNKCTTKLFRIIWQEFTDVKRQKGKKSKKKKNS